MKKYINILLINSHNNQIQINIKVCIRGIFFSPLDCPMVWISMVEIGSHGPRHLHLDDSTGFFEATFEWLYWPTSGFEETGEPTPMGEK